MHCLACAIRYMLEKTHTSDACAFHLSWAAQGLLGDARWFRDYFERPITQGQDRGANAREAHHANAKAAELRRLTAPFLLRREKRSVLGSGQAEAAVSEAAVSETSEVPEASTPVVHARAVVDDGGDVHDGAAVEASTVAPVASNAPAQRLGRKNDLIVWLELHPLQRAIYEVAWWHACVIAPLFVHLLCLRLFW